MPTRITDMLDWIYDEYREDLSLEDTIKEGLLIIINKINDSKKFERSADSKKFERKDDK